MAMTRSDMLAYDSGTFARAYAARGQEFTIGDPTKHDKTQ